MITGSRISSTLDRSGSLDGFSISSDGAVAQQELVDDGRRRRDQVHVVLALEPLLHDVHVQQAEEAAAEAEAQRLRDLGLEVQRRVVELQLVQRVAQRLVLVRLDRVEAGEHLRLDFLEPRQRSGGRLLRVGDRVADLRLGELLDARDDEAHLARGELVAADGLRREDAHLLAQVDGAGRHQQHLVARLQRAVDHAQQHHDADVVVEPRVDDQRLQRRVGIPGGRRDPRDHRLEDVVDAFAGLGAGADRVLRVDADDVLDLLDHPLGLGRRQVDLVQHRHDLDALLDRRVAVRDRLRLDALRRVDDQQRALAGGERARDLVGEVDVPRRVDQVEAVLLPVARRVGQRGGLRLDGDAALPLEIHRVEDLRLHLPVGQPAAALDEAVGQRRLAVVDVGDDREVADMLHGVGVVRRAAEWVLAGARGPGRYPPSSGGRAGTGKQKGHFESARGVRTSC